jgi:hypothetical protein
MSVGIVAGNCLRQHNLKQKPRQPPKNLLKQTCQQNPNQSSGHLPSFMAS